MWQDGFVEALIKLKFDNQPEWEQAIDRLADQALTYRPSANMRRKDPRADDRARIAIQWVDRAEAIMAWLRYNEPSSNPADIKVYRHISSCIEATE